jgi:hypothetical protein
MIQAYVTRSYVTGTREVRTKRPNKVSYMFIYRKNRA